MFKEESLFSEELAIRVYQLEGYKAKWTENNFWWLIMSLLFWDVIFAKIRGSVVIRSSGFDYELDPSEDNFEDYFNKTVIQMNGMPHDFFTEEFYSRRNQIILNRIKELQNADIILKLRDSYENNKGKKCRPIENWDKYSFQDISDIITNFDKEKVLEICHRLLKDFSSYRSGLPDLFVYSEKDIFFAEVKSKSDRLTDKQINWHRYLSENLNLKVELFLINHSEKQISSVMSRN